MARAGDMPRGDTPARPMQTDLDRLNVVAAGTVAEKKIEREHFLFSQCALCAQGSG
tara:strand:+ start:691 stop:858 length:168 start_codon:yes stop_codon:yes gene_type:complete